MASFHGIETEPRGMLSHRSEVMISGDQKYLRTCVDLKGTKGAVIIMDHLYNIRCYKTELRE